MVLEIACTVDLVNALAVLLVAGGGYFNGLEPERGVWLLFDLFEGLRGLNGERLSTLMAIDEVIANVGMVVRRVISFDADGKAWSLRCGHNLWSLLQRSCFAHRHLGVGSRPQLSTAVSWPLLSTVAACLLRHGCLLVLPHARPLLVDDRMDERLVELTWRGGLWPMMRRGQVDGGGRRTRDRNRLLLRRDRSKLVWKRDVLLVRLHVVGGDVHHLQVIAEADIGFLALRPLLMEGASALAAPALHLGGEEPGSTPEHGRLLIRRSYVLATELNLAIALMPSEREVEGVTLAARIQQMVPRRIESFILVQSFQVIGCMLIHHGHLASFIEIIRLGLRRRRRVVPVELIDELLRTIHAKGVIKPSSGDKITRCVLRLLLFDLK